MITEIDRLEKEYKEELIEAIEADEDWVRIMLMDSVQEAADGCRVEPDGTCPHGYRSPAILLGII